MAKSQETYNKKERTKKRLQRRKEKELRRDEKRLEGPAEPKGLDDMLAYVDENGNISLTPPDPKKMKKVVAEEILVSTPKDSELEGANEPTRGEIIHFDSSKGYGFISDSMTKERIFYHISAIVGQELEVGDKVEYAAIKTPRGFQAETLKKYVPPTAQELAEAKAKEELAAKAKEDLAAENAKPDAQELAEKVKDDTPADKRVSEGSNN